MEIQGDKSLDYPLSLSVGENFQKLKIFNDGIISQIIFTISLVPLFIVPMIIGEHKVIGGGSVEKFYYAILHTNDSYNSLSSGFLFFLGFLITITIFINIIVLIMIKSPEPDTSYGYHEIERISSNHIPTRTIEKILFIEAISTTILIISTFLTIYYLAELNDHRPYPRGTDFVTHWGFGWGTFYLLCVTTIQLLRRLLRSIRYNRFWRIFNILSIFILLIFSSWVLFTIYLLFRMVM